MFTTLLVSGGLTVLLLAADDLAAETAAAVQTEAARPVAIVESAGASRAMPALYSGDGTAAGQAADQTRTPAGPCREP
jgi:hypothetical protein